MKTLKLANSFHNTSTTIRVTDPSQDQHKAWTELQVQAWDDAKAAAKVRRIKRALCGMSDCCCGTVR